MKSVQRIHQSFLQEDINFIQFRLGSASWELVELNIFFSSYFSLLHGAHTSSAGADDTGVPVVSQIRISCPHAPHHHSVVLSLTGQTALVVRLQQEL